MWKALVSLVEKWACRHEWNKITEVQVNNSWGGISHWKFLLVCKKCGKIKWIKTK